MVHKLIEWALNNPFIVLLMTAAVTIVGLVCFQIINVEAYPDPAPAIVEVVAQWPGASAEEMERLVTVPLEVSLAGMPGLKVTYSKSLFSLTHLRIVFQYGHPYKDARQEVINRLSSLTQPLPAGVNPVISPASPIGEIYRYTLKTPKNSLGQEIYSLNDVKSLQDWLIERQFKRVPSIMDVSSFGGTVKRYEIQPDPERMKQFGITLGQLQTALAKSNANVGGDYMVQGRTSQVVRCLGTIGAGKDPMERAFSMRTAEEAAAFMREEEQKRLREIRSIVIVSTNGVPKTIDDIVVGGPLKSSTSLSLQGVVVSNQTRLGMIAQDKSMDSFQIADETLIDLSKKGMPEKLTLRLASLKDRDFDSRAGLFNALLRDRFKVTDDALRAMEKDEVPQDVRAKLAPMKNQEFETRELFRDALDRILSREEQDTYGAIVLKKASSPVLNKSDFERYKDLIAHYAVGVRYVLTAKSLGALSAKDIPKNIVEKLATLKDKEGRFVFLDRGFKTRARFVAALSELPELLVRYKLTAEDVAELHQEIPADIMARIEPLKEKGFKTEKLFLHAVGAAIGTEKLESYELTQRSLEELSARGMEPAMLNRVATLLDQPFRSAPAAAQELDKVLDKNERKRFQEPILSSLRSIKDLLAGKAEMDRYLDVVLDQAAIHWRHQDEKVQGVVLMRKGEESLKAIEGVKAKVAELNAPGRLLPGVELETYYDREDLVHLTTHTVRENLIVGIVLVVIILMMFLSNIKTAIIVALNIPIALLFAFAVLYMRGESANLLSIGAVDFGIIVDSAVIMTENIYRNLASGEHADLPLKDRILRATREVDKALFFSTLIMVVAFIPLFTMRGAEGQLFGPMAQTYAFALGGALVMALTLTPVLCLLLLKHVKPISENFLVRFLKNRYLWQLRVCLNHSYITVGVMALILGFTAVWALPRVGREFMPELEEGSLWIRGIYPVNTSLDTVRDSVQQARKVMHSEKYPEVAAVVAQIGRPDDGTDPGLFNNVEVFVPLRPEREWPVIDRPNGITQVRTRRELVDDMKAELRKKLPGIEWQFSQYIRDNVMEAISGVKGDNCVKIFGPDLDKLEELAEKMKAEMGKIKGIQDLGIYRIMGQSNLEFVVDKEKCKRVGMQVDDVNAVITAAVHGNAVTQMVEGEKLFDITVRWPFNRRSDREKILAMPVDVWNNNLTPGFQSGTNQSTIQGPSGGPSASGTSNNSPTNQSANMPNPASTLPGRMYLREFVSPISRGDWRPDPDRTELLDSNAQRIHPLTLTAGKTYVFSVTSPAFVPELKLRDTQGEIVAARNGVRNDARSAIQQNELSYTPLISGTYRVEIASDKADSDSRYSLVMRTLGGEFSRPAGSIITREDGKRFIAVKFSVGADRDLASVVNDVRDKTANLLQPPYFLALGGEFEQMEDGERRLMMIIPCSLALIFILLYVAFNSLLDAVVILSNVLDLAVGGIWALYLTGTNFSMSAAVGFVSLFGVAIMDGLLMIAYFNDLRSKGLPVDEAIMKGAAIRVRPVTMTCLTAILGLLPAAFSTAIGSQTQRPLAIVVVGGMMTTLFLTRYLMPVIYSFYGHREPPKGASHMAH